MLKNLIIFILFTSIGIGLVIVYVSTSKTPSQITQSPIKPTPTSQSQFSLENAPSQSIKGKVTSLTGDVKWQDRVATQASEIKNPVTIQQGEELTTGENGSVSVEIPTAAKVIMSSDTKVSFVQTLPQNIVFAQALGTSKYQKTGSFPVSVRTLRLLTQIESGSITATISDTLPIITIDVLDGSTTAAFNDSQNISTILTINKGEKLTFNNDTRQGVVK